MSRKDSNFYNAMHDYGYHHGFQSRGIAPSFLGSDSLPQGIADLHWALHGVQGNMDALDGRMKGFEDNLLKIADDMKDDVIKYIGDKLLASKTPLTNDTGYISKIETTRPNIFSDRFEGEYYATNNPERIRGYTENYSWVQYSVPSDNCEGVYNKIIDFNFIADHQEKDGNKPRRVTKGKIKLEKAGLINRIFITQKGTNIVLHYLLTSSYPTQTGVAYTGAIKRVEYDKCSNKVSESFTSVNHTPLVMLGAFNADANNEKEFVQYISTDYKLYQNYEGTDVLLGELPQDVITLIDPVNDLVSDTKQAYIMTYTNDGKVKFPMEGFTLVDTMSKEAVIPKFKIIKFENDTELFKNFVSISPRTQTTLTQKFDPSKQLVVEGGYYLELWEEWKVDIYDNMPTSHMFLLSSTEEVYDHDRFSHNVNNYWAEAPSRFSNFQERDYTEFDQITFKSGISKMFPHLVEDFGIADDVPFTLEFDRSRNKETVTVHLPEPFVITRDIPFGKNVSERTGFTVLRNSDYLLDKGTLYNLSTYAGLDFVIVAKDSLKDYYSYIPTYNEKLKPKWGYYRIRINYTTEDTTGNSTYNVTHFSGDYNADISLNPKSETLAGVRHINDNRNRKQKDKTFNTILNKSDYIADLTQTDTIFLSISEGIAGSNSYKALYKDIPYLSTNGTIVNTNTFGSSHQKLYTYEQNHNDINDRAIVVFERLSSEEGENAFGEWMGHGTTLTPKFLHIAGNYNSKSGYSADQLKAENKRHAVFRNIISHNFDVEAVNDKYTHIDYTITNELGLVMHYHNIAVREDRDGRIPRTAKPYTLKFSKWIPGEYVGNEDNPYPPDTNAFNKEILRRITDLEAQDINVRDTKSVDLTKTGDWDTNPKETRWDPNEQQWTPYDNIITLSADVKLDPSRYDYVINNKTENLPNGVLIKNEGVYAPDYLGVISEMSKQIEQLKESNKELTNVVKSIVKDLIDNGAWDPNKKPDENDNTQLTGGLKDGIGIAYGNINLFGGVQDGNSFIRTNAGRTENDLAGGL